MEIIALEKDRYYKNYEENNGEYCDLMLSKLRKKVKVVILAENIFIKVIECEKREFRNNSNKIINDNILMDENTLIDYKYDAKSKKVFIYSLKQGYKVKKICEKVSNIKVKPLQYIIKEIVDKKVKKDKSYIILYKFYDYLYFIVVDEGYIYNTSTLEYSTNNLNYLIKKAIEIDSKRFIDNSISDVLVNDDISKFNDINIGKEVISEVFKKQGFYSKKLYRR